MAGEREVILHWDKKIWTPAGEDDKDAQAKLAFCKQQRAEQCAIYGRKLRTIISPIFDLEYIQGLNPSRVMMVIEDEALRTTGSFLTTLVTPSIAESIAMSGRDWSENVDNRFRAGVSLAEMGVAAFLADASHNLSDVFIGKQGISFVPKFRP